MKKPLLLFLLVHLLFSFFAHTQNDDIDLLKFINLKRSTSLDKPMKALSNSIYGTAAVPAIIFTTAFIKKDSLNERKAIVIAGALCISGIISTGMKYGINRKRPFDTYPILQNLSSPVTPSFPSGHTSEAFTLSTSLSMAYPKWYVIAPSFLWAGLVGYSRMHMGVHYPSDVLAGAFTGAGSAWLSVKINKWWDKKTVRR